jgi:hypothetical protein
MSPEKMLTLVKQNVHFLTYVKQVKLTVGYIMFNLFNLIDKFYKMPFFIFGIDIAL